MPRISAGQDRRVVDWGCAAGVDTPVGRVLSWRGRESGVAGQGGLGRGEERSGAARNRRIGLPGPDRLPDGV